MQSGSIGNFRGDCANALIVRAASPIETSSESGADELFLKAGRAGFRKIVCPPRIFAMLNSTRLEPIFFLGRLWPSGLRSALLFAFLAFASSLSGCGGPLAGKINPLPIDVVRDNPPDDEGGRRRFRRYGGRGGGGGGSYGGDSSSAEELWEAKCSEVSALMGRGEYAEAAGRLNPGDPSMNLIFSAYQSGDYNEASRLLNRLFSRSPCRRLSPAGGTIRPLLRRRLSPPRLPVFAIERRESEARS